MVTLIKIRIRWGGKYLFFFHRDMDGLRDAPVFVRRLWSQGVLINAAASTLNSIQVVRRPLPALRTRSEIASNSSQWDKCPEGHRVP